LSRATARARLFSTHNPEKTEEQYEKLGQESGWKLVKTWKSGPGGSEGPYRHYEFKLNEQE
jgi:hypothetical protein